MSVIESTAAAAVPVATSKTLELFVGATLSNRQARSLERARAKAFARAMEREIDADRQRELADIELEALSSIALSTISSKLRVLRQLAVMTEHSPRLRALTESVIEHAHARQDDVFDRAARSLARSR